MNNLSRRALLKCLAALPAARAFDTFTPSLSWASSPRQAAAQPITQLNVVFHGLIGFFVENGRIYAMPADVRDHVFLAGNRGKLMTLTRQLQYKLHGVKGGDGLPDFREAHNPVIHAALTRDSSKAYCTLELPYPDDVSPQRHIPKTDGEFFSGHDKPQNLVDLPLALVFVYKNFNREELRLDPLGWTPQVRNGVANLHVHAEPTRVASGHTVEAFPHLLPPLGNPDLILNNTYIHIRAPLKDPDPPIDGVSCDDLMHLIEQGETARSCAEFRKTAKKVTSLAHPDNCIHLTVIPQ